MTIEKINYYNVLGVEEAATPAQSTPELKSSQTVAA